MLKNVVTLLLHGFGMALSTGNSLFRVVVLLVKAKIHYSGNLMLWNQASYRFGPEIQKISGRVGENQ
jgi:hypothetical protein